MLKKTAVTSSIALALVTSDLAPSAEALKLKDSHLQETLGFDGAQSDVVGSYGAPGGHLNHQLVEAKYYEKGDTPATTPRINLKTMLENSVASSSFTPYGCDSGIKRFTNGTSNSIEAYEAAMNSSALWEDPEFGADTTSLRWDKYGFATEDAAYAPPKDLLWKRPAEMGQGYPLEPSLWGDFKKPIPNGINQQSLGDCWFLAAASAIAETPDRVYKFTYDKEYNKHGIFRFFFWVKNGWYGINIDDRLPSKNYGRGFRPWATQRSYAKAWWMPLLEKAYAKLDQNYDRIIGGWGKEGLRTLTGMPTMNFWNSQYSREYLEPMYKYFASKNFPMTAACCQGGSVYGLVSGHAYTFLDIQDLKDGTGTVVHTIAKVRNPWAVEMYKGPWRDDDPNWTEEWKKQVKLVQANDGAFWLPMDVYLSKFYNLGVSLYQPYKYMVMDVYASERTYKYEVKNTVKQFLYITAETYSERHYPRAKCNPRTNVVLYFMDEMNQPVDKQNYEFVSAGFGTVGRWSKELAPGTYYFTVVNQGYKSAAVDLSLNFYATEKVPTVNQL